MRHVTKVVTLRWQYFVCVSPAGRSCQELEKDKVSVICLISLDYENPIREFIESPIPVEKESDVSSDGDSSTSESESDDIVRRDIFL